MAQFYRCFIKNFAFIMAPITKLMKKTKFFIWTIKCQEAWDQIKHKYMEPPILIPPNWQLLFHMHTYASLLVVGAMLAQNPNGKYD
jgi:tryptophan-rich sensory protein